VPADLDQTFSSVRQAQADLLQSAGQLGIVPSSYNLTPKQTVDEFYRRDPSGDLDRIYAAVIKNAPSLKLAESNLLQAQRDLEKAKLDLRYCTVVAEIDGVITRRNVNPGNNVQVGESLMAIRSLRDIWIDANFKETQLRNLRIGQRADLEVDMYGGKRIFEGRISGFTMGTGSTLALLPAQNATGNFVKVVQRLPVRIDVMNYDPDKLPLFVGLSVTPTVDLRTAPTGPNAGKFLREPSRSGASANPCGMAASLGMLIGAHVLQGLAGGGLQPSSQAVLLDAFPKEKQGAAQTVFGLAALLAPVVGPTLGGYITDNYGWRWIFYINIPSGLLALWMCSKVVRDPDYLKAEQLALRKKGAPFDTLGLCLLSLTMVSWEIVLSKGQEWDWLGDPFFRVQTLLALFALGLSALVWRELRISNPLINFRTLAERNFRWSCVVIFGAFGVLYANTTSLPALLQSLFGYDATTSGLVLSPSGVVAVRCSSSSDCPSRVGSMRAGSWPWG
jgi:MFS family permease